MVTLNQMTLKAIRDHAARAYPREACGLLLGRWNSDDRRLATAARAIVNIRSDRARDRYELDPRQHLAVQREARRLGLDIVGAYHSHPDAAAIPSATDRSRAAAIWGDQRSWSYVIVPVTRDGAGAPRAWVLAAGQFEEETVTDAGADEFTSDESL